MKRARFGVIARLDRPRPQEGTVTVCRSTGLVSVRPKRRRREYTLPLSVVAEVIVSLVLKAELAERRRAKKGARRGR